MEKTKKNGYPAGARLRLDALRKKAYRPIGKLHARAAVTSEPVPPEQRGSLTYRPVLPGQVWAKRVYDCAWFHMQGELPENADSRDLWLSVNIGGEGLIYGNSGAPYEMISSKMNAVDSFLAERGKTAVRVSDAICSGNKIDFFMDAGFNGTVLSAPFGMGVFRYAYITERNPGFYSFYYDYLAVLSVFAALPAGQGRELAEMLQAAYQAAMAGDSAEGSRLLAPALQGGPADFTLYAVGHSHLDLAWLWPVRETKRKSARTFTKQLNNIDRYPQYIYGASQPWQFEYLRANEPAVWRRIEAAVRAGRIEPQGGMYVEADTNLSGGEALIRQLYYGKTFFREAFGQEMRICWLPDVFGYNGNLPQLLRGTGIPYFFTIKLSWNEHNRFPYRSFHWSGIDGSRVLVHMAPDETYNSDALPASAIHAWQNYPEKDVSDAALYVYGVGDGGGGPGEGFLELLNRQRTLVHTPEIRFSRAIDYFKRLEAVQAKLPEYAGELYLEKHQGTYTTQGRNKRYNRLTEYALEDTEALCAMAYLRGRPYPQQKLDGWWKEALLYQFHDIIPGSAIGRVYKESVARYAQMLREITQEKKAALRFLCGAGDTPLAYDPMAFSAAPPLPPAEDPALAAGDTFLKNGCLEVRFNADGEIVSLRDSAGTEFAAGPMNRLKLFFDKPLMFNAWDIDWKYHDREGRTLKPYRHTVSKEKNAVTRVNYYRHGKTELRQQIVLAAGADTLEIRTFADWHETFQMLRAEFLPAVQSDTVACDIQFGSIFRSTGDKTPEEKAQFEICAHKYVDVSDGEKGFSLLNNCKYGHRVKEGLISLNLLRSPVFPDPKADRGRHEFTYALYPHKGGLSEDTLARAYALNKPKYAFTGETGFENPLRVNTPNVVITLLKKAYRENAVIVRMYESQGREAAAALTVGFGYKAVYAVDLMEENPVSADPAKLTFRPYEIKTLLFQL